MRNWVAAPVKAARAIEVCAEVPLDRRDPDPDRMRTIVLVGFMAAGKTTVGRLLAERLGWRFVDLDEHIEGRTGSSIAAIFRDSGEPAFRELEGRMAAQFLSEHDCVLATGGGWAAGPGALDRLPAHVRSIWLRVSAEEVVRRIGGSPAVRPLLQVTDPLAEARALLATREPFYRKADWHVDVDDRSPAEIAAGIMNLLD